MSKQSKIAVDTRPAEALEEFLVPTLFGPWAVEVVDRAALQSGEFVLDVGCGTRPATRLAAERVGKSGHVSGLDLNEGMLAVAKRCAEREGHRIEWHKGDVTELPFEDEEFNVVLCCQGLQFFPDKQAALAQMHRVLKSGGRIAASIWRDVEFCPGHSALAHALAEQSGTKPGPMPPFSLGDAGEIRTLAAAAGFQNPDVSAVRRISPFGSAREFIDALAAGAPSTRQALQSLDENEKDTVITSVTKALRDITDSRGLQLPLESHILTARK